MTAIELEGVINFRDFGGGSSDDGRRIRTGQLYRSGHFATATETDLQRLASMDFALFVDLRRPPERARDPARRPAGHRGAVIEHRGPMDAALAPHLQFLSQPGATPDLLRKQMMVGYRGYPFDPHYLAIYREYFARLGGLDGPVLVNCHAGKDRTGFLCALTLHVLGAPREEIIDDYLATNRHSRADARMAEITANFEANYGHAPREDLVRAMLAVEVEWLDAAFAAIGYKHGDVDTYLAEEVGLTIEGREAIRARLLT